MQSRKMRIRKHNFSASDSIRQEATAITRLRAAFRKNDITLYVGAGASAASGVPMWDSLLLNVYLNSLNKVRVRGAVELFGYVLQATGERWFAKSGAPLDVAARALRASFRSPTEFVRWVRFGLYQSFNFDSRGHPTLDRQSLVRGNKTLGGIAKLCRRTRPGKRGLRAVVNYNLDGLLERALGSYPFQSFWKPAKAESATLPIYHVHGYLPLRDPFSDYSPRLGSLSDEIVLTEDQYHREAADPYSWANLVQLGAMSRSIGLTIGLSLSDPNLRRLLDAARRAPIRPEIYSILQKPEATELDEAGIEEIETNLPRIMESYITRTPDWPDLTSKKVRDQIKQIWEQLERASLQRQVSVLRELGVEPIWCRHDNIPSVVDKIVSGAR
jgi:hypothetical protein